MKISFTKAIKPCEQARLASQSLASRSVAKVNTFFLDITTLKGRIQQGLRHTKTHLPIR